MLDLLTFSRMSSAMAVSNAFSRAMKSHASVSAGTSKELLGFSDHEGNGVCAFLHCDIRASLHDCCSASVMLGFGQCNCVLIWRLRCCHSSAGGSRSVIELGLQDVRDVVGCQAFLLGSVTFTVTALSWFLDHRLRYHARLCRLKASVGLITCDTCVFCGLTWRATHSLPSVEGTGVLWVLTGTRPCGPPPRQDGGGTRAPALTYVHTVCVYYALVDVSVAADIVV